MTEEKKNIIKGRQQPLFEMVLPQGDKPLMSVKKKSPAHILNDEWYKSFMDKSKRPTMEPFGQRVGIFQHLLLKFSFDYILAVCKFYWSAPRWDWQARTTKNFLRFWDDIVHDMEKEMDRREEESGGGDPDGI